MASCQLQKPAEQTYEHTSGQKISEMTHQEFKSCSEYKHLQGHQGQEAGYTVVACQTQCSGQTYAHQPDQGIPKVQTHWSRNTHNLDCHGKKEKSLKEKFAEKTNKVKSLFKKKNQECGCDDRSSSSSSDSESDNDACRKKN
ncbi:hypothetical protein BT93_D2044 [Corymbia citriodora subsp. variegata]|nr:hypothetical protein BT93_D2044 [Corymbia citriodora subsp. variegata]